MIDKIILGLKSGELWYLYLSIYIHVFSTFLYFRAANKEYDSVEKQVRDVTFAGRMIIASLTAEVISLLTLIETKSLAIILGIIVCIIAIILMIKIESLPIWEEGER